MMKFKKAITYSAASFFGIVITWGLILRYVETAPTTELSMFPILNMIILALLVLASMTILAMVMRISRSH